ncbi:11393_t:CDS:2, partial [Gigaspora margarita]
MTMSTKILRNKRLIKPEVPKSFYTLESPKEKDRQLETKKKEIKNQQKSSKLDFYDENYEQYREETPMIFIYKNSTISINAACKNTIEAFSNFKEKLSRSEEKSQEKEEEELDQKTLLQEMVDKINAEKDIPKELIELLKAELNRANTMGLNSQNIEVDNISNFQLKNQKADSAKKVKSKIDSSGKDEYSKIDIVKEDILNIRWNSKPLENNRTDTYHDPGISCQNKVNLVKNAQSTENLKDDIPIEEGDTVKENKTCNLTNQELYYRDEISLEKPTKIKDRLKTFSYCQKSAKMKHVDETIEGYFENRTSIEADIEPNSTNDLEHTCEDWKERVNNLKRIVKNPYEPKDPKSYKIADTVQDAETSRKDKAQSIQPLQNLKSGYQELKITNSIRIKKKICVHRSKNKKKQWLEMFFKRTTIIKTILCEIIQYLLIQGVYTRIFDPGGIFKRIVKTYLSRKEITKKILEKHNRNKVLRFDATQVKRHIKKILTTLD